MSLTIRVGPTRFRIPDLCVFPRNRKLEQIPATPPLVCIEILSPEDKWSHFERRIQDFLAMGVERVWVFDPQERRVFECTKNGRREVLDDLLEAPPVSIRISELMAELD
jgi:Uma2 family endonuclease